MRNSILVLLVMLGLAGIGFAANIYWEGDDSHAWSTGSNWYGGSAPTSTDTAYFHGDSADGTCSLDVNVHVYKLYFDATYDENWKLPVGKICTTAVASFDAAANTDTMQWSGTFYQDAAGSFTMNNGPTYTADLCTLVFRAKSTLSNASAGTQTFTKIDGAYAAGDTLTVSTATINITQWTIGEGVWNQTTTLDCRPTAQTDLAFNAAHKIRGSGNIKVQVSPAITLNVPTINAPDHSGTWSFTTINTNAVVFDMVGAIIDKGGTLEIDKTWTGRLTWNQNGNTIKATRFQIGNSYATDSAIFNFDQSLDLAGMFETTTNNAGVTIINATTSTWTCGNNWAFGTNTTFNAGTSQITFDETGATPKTLTSAGETFYDVIFNKVGAGHGITLSDALSVGGDLTLTDGTFDQAGKNVTVVGDVAINTNDAATIDGYWSVGGDFTLGASSSATVTGSRVKLSKANAVVALNNKTMPACSSAAGVYFEDGGTIARLVMQNPRDTIKLEALKKFTFTALDSADINGKADSLTYWLSSSAGSRDTLDFPSTMYFSYTAWKDQISSDTVYVNDGTSDNLGGNLWP